MSDFSDDILARRLESLEIIDPRASEVTARVLARASARRAPGLLMRSAWFATLLVTLTLATAYFAPAFSQSLADGPIGGFAGGLLRGFGLASHTDRITVLDDTTSASGITLQLVGGYADGTRTLILLRTTPAAYPSGGASPAVLRDQFGQSYNLRSAGGNIETGETVLQFEPLRWPASAVGARFTLAVSHMLLGGRTDVSGNWAVHGTIALDEAVELKTPAPIDVGGIHFDFTRARVLPTVIAIDFRASGDIDLLHARVSTDNPKGAPMVQVELSDAAGRPLKMLQADLTGAGSDLTGQWLWAFDGPAPYTLHVSVAGSGSAQRVVAP